MTVIPVRVKLGLVPVLLVAAPAIEMTQTSEVVADE
jgi:hypothetical protein